MRVSLSADVGSIVAQFVSAEGERAGPLLASCYNGFDSARCRALGTRH